MQQFPRITLNPAQMGGKPCVRGMRVTVGMIVNHIANACTPEQIIEQYPYLEKEDIQEALAYAAWRVEEQEVDLAST